MRQQQEQTLKASGNIIDGAVCSEDRQTDISPHSEGLISCISQKVNLPCIHFPFVGGDHGNDLLESICCHLLAAAFFQHDCKKGIHLQLMSVRFELNILPDFRLIHLILSFCIEFFTFSVATFSFAQAHKFRIPDFQDEVLNNIN